MGCVLTLAFLLRNSGSFQEAEQLMIKYQEYETLLGQESPDELMQWLSIKGEISLNLGKYDERNRCVDAIVELAEICEDTDEYLQAMILAAFACEDREAINKGLLITHKALEKASTLEQWSESYFGLLLGEGALRRLRGEHEKAVEAFYKALNYLDDENKLDTEDHSAALRYLALGYSDTDPEKAEDVLSMSIALAVEHSGDESVALGKSLGCLAILKLKLNEHEESEALSERAREILSMRGAWYGPIQREYERLKNQAA